MHKWILSFLSIYVGSLQAQSCPHLKDEICAVQSDIDAKDSHKLQQRLEIFPVNTEEKEQKKREEKEDKKEEEISQSPHTFTGTVSFVSDYRFRGISQTMRQPAVQGNLDYSHSDGIYLGVFGSNVDGTAHFYNNTSLEWDFYGGNKGKCFRLLVPDLAYDIGFIYYDYPGGRADNRHNVRYNTLEYYIGINYQWFSVKFWQALTDYFGVNSDNPPFNWRKNCVERRSGSSRYSTYIEANAAFDLWQKLSWRCLRAGKLKLLFHLGHVTVRNNEDLSYTDWRVTLTQEFEWLNIFLSYLGTDAKKAYYDIPDHSYRPRKRSIGGQEILVGASRSF